MKNKIAETILVESLLSQVEFSMLFLLYLSKDYSWNWKLI